MAFVRRIWPILLLALAPLWPLRRAAFLGEAIGPFDQIRQMAPWNGPKPAQPWDVLQADGVLQFYVWRDLVFESWRNGRVPQWNPYELCGTPLLANSQSAALYPPHVLAGLMHLPTALAVTWLAWFHLALAGVGAYWLCRALGARILGGLASGLGFSLSAFMVLWTGLPSVISTVAWMPWVLASVLSCLDVRRNPGRGAWGGPVLLAFSVAMMLLAGHLQFAAYGLMAAAATALGCLIVERANLGRRALRLAIGLALGLALAAPQLLPVAAYSRSSHRQNAPTEEGYRAYVAGAIRPYELANLTTYRALGDPRTYSDVAPMPNYWAPLTKRGANLAESAVTVGPVALLLLLLAPFLRIPSKAWASVGSVGALALLLALGTPVNRLLYFVVPGWSATGSPGRIVVLFVLAAAVLAGLAIDRFRELDVSPKTRWLTWAVFVAASLGFWRLAQANVPALTEDGAVMARFNSGWMMPAVLSILAGLGVASSILARPLRASRWALGALVVSSVAVSIGGLAPMTSHAPLASIPHDGPSKRVAIVNEAWGLGSAAPALIPPNLAALSRIREVGGYDSLIHRDTVAMLKEILGADPAPPANGNIMFVKPTFDPKLLAESGAEEVWTRGRDPRLDRLLGEPRDRGGFFAYGLPGPGRASLTGGRVRIASDEPGHIRARLSGSGELVVRERALPGWTARYGTRTLQVPEGRWIRVPGLGPGDAEVDLRYEAPGLRSGLLIGGSALLLWLAVAASVFFGERPRGNGT